MADNRIRPKQPAYFILRNQGRSIAGAARVMGVPYLVLRGAVYGHNRPHPEIRERLPLLTGVSLSELFTPDKLTEYRSRPPRRTTGPIP